MLSWKIMKATSAACECICMGTEAAEHYGYRYSLWHRWVDWWRGFIAGCLGDHAYHLSMTQRTLRFVHWHRRASRSRHSLEEA
ncbi:hypothetical protein B0G84_7637 [Paraburkholderia sp. BL8N3]|nr:hypothetical protein B0G84_7637 [Paraburkholderia sp. BL8N3]